MKVCSGCKVEKDKGEFHKSSQNKDGLCGRCKSCRKIENKKYSKTEKYKLYQRDWQRKYLKNEKKKKYIEQYTKSESFKNVQKKYRQSEKGRDRSSNIRSILAKTSEDRKLITGDVIDLKRVQMKLKRKIKEIENENQ